MRVSIPPFHYPPLAERPARMPRASICAPHRRLTRLFGRVNRVVHAHCRAALGAHIEGRDGVRRHRRGNGPQQAAESVHAADGKRKREERVCGGKRVALTARCATRARACRGRPPSTHTGDSPDFRPCLRPIRPGLSEGCTRSSWFHPMSFALRYAGRFGVWVAFLASCKIACVVGPQVRFRADLERRSRA